MCCVDSLPIELLYQRHEATAIQFNRPTHQVQTMKAKWTPLSKYVFVHFRLLDMTVNENNQS